MTLLTRSGRGMLVRAMLERAQQSFAAVKPRSRHLKSLSSKCYLSPSRGIRKLLHICCVSSVRGAVNPGPRWRCCGRRRWRGHPLNAGSGGGRHRTEQEFEIEEPVMQRWQRAHQLMISSFLFSSQYSSIQLNTVSATHTHTHTVRAQWR